MGTCDMTRTAAKEPGRSNFFESERNERLAYESSSPRISLQLALGFFAQAYYPKRQAGVLHLEKAGGTPYPLSSVGGHQDVLANKLVPRRRRWRANRLFRRHESASQACKSIPRVVFLASRESLVLFVRLTSKNKSDNAVFRGCCCCCCSC